jgi:hypothetical protein
VVLGVRLDADLMFTEHVCVDVANWRWGLHNWWVGMQGVEAGDVSIVLAADEAGRAAAWVKTFKKDALGAGRDRPVASELPGPAAIPTGCGRA